MSETSTTGNRDQPGRARGLRRAPVRALSGGVRGGRRVQALAGQDRDRGGRPSLLPDHDEPPSAAPERRLRGQSQQGQNVVVGPLVYSLALGMSVSDVSGKAIANLATEELSHPAPVFHGDTLFARERGARGEGVAVEARPRRGAGPHAGATSRTARWSRSSSARCWCRGARYSGGRDPARPRSPTPSARTIRPSGCAPTTQRAPSRRSRSSSGRRSCARAPSRRRPGGRTRSRSGSGASASSSSRARPTAVSIRQPLWRAMQLAPRGGSRVPRRGPRRARSGPAAAGADWRRAAALRRRLARSGSSPTRARSWLRRWISWAAVPAFAEVGHAAANTAHQEATWTAM